MKFKLIKDLILNNGFEDIIIMSEGSIIEPNEEGLYVFENLGKSYTKDDITSKPEIFEIFNELDLNISQIDESLENVVKNFRIQLDIKTSMKNLKIIEKFIKDNVSSMI